MPWSHFTTLLDGTRPITKLERDELYDQLAAKFCPPRYTLPSATMTPLKASLLITDRAAIFDSLFNSTTFGRLETLITGVSGAFSNTAAAKTSALALAGITAGNLGTILAALTDDYRLWNFLRSWIDLLTPNPPPNPTFVSRTASASKTKCGFGEWSGYESTPPKFYRRCSYSGTGIYYYYDPMCDPVSPTGSSEASYNITGSQYEGTLCAYSRDEQLCVTFGDGSTSCTSASGPAQPLLLGWTSETISATSYYRINSLSGGCGQIQTETETRSLSDEHTTAQLITEALAAIPAFSGIYLGGVQTALNNIASDEFTVSVRSMQYKFTLPTLTGYTAYRIDWTEVFTPTVGSPTGTDRSYTWDLSASETPAYTITAPSTEGSTAVVITGITASC